MQEAATLRISEKHADSLPEGVAPHPEIMQSFDKDGGTLLIRGEKRADGTHPRENGASELSSNVQLGPATDNSRNSTGTV